MSAAAALYAASGVFGAYGAIQQGKAQSKSYRSQAEAELYNAAVSEQEAQSALQQGNVAEEAMRRDAAQVIGEQQAATAQAGIGYEGTAADLMKQSIANREYDALAIRYQAMLKRRGFMEQAVQARRQASMLKTAGKEAKKASYIAAIGSILGGGAQAARAS